MKSTKNGCYFIQNWMIFAFLPTDHENIMYIHILEILLRSLLPTFWILISIECFSEFVCEGSSWARVRNVQMLIVMKLISLISNLHDRRIQLPSFTEFFGYIFCVGNCIFGPWMDYASYMDLFRPTRKLVKMNFYKNDTFYNFCL